MISTTLQNMTTKGPWILVGTKEKQTQCYFMTLWSTLQHFEERITGPYFDHMTAPVDCLTLFANDYIDLGYGKSRAPNGIPPEPQDEYTMGGRIQLIKAYYSDIYLGRTKSIPLWSVKNVDNLIRLAKELKREIWEEHTEQSKQKHYVVFLSIHLELLMHVY